MVTAALATDFAFPLDADDVDRRDAVRCYADRTLWEYAAPLLMEGDEFSKDQLVIVDHHETTVASLLADRGLGLSDQGSYWLIHSLANCPDCGEDKPIDRPCSACASMMGPAPTDEFPADDSGALCPCCLHAVSGPPGYCCTGRQKLVEALHGDDFPIRPCQMCHGAGQQPMGVACDACSGTGVDLGKVA